MDTAADPERTVVTGGAETPGARGGAASAGTPASGTSGTPGGTTPPRTASEPASRPRTAPAPAALVFDDPFDRPSADDTDRGWGDPVSGAADDDFTRFLNEKPPHHL